MIKRKQIYILIIAFIVLVIMITWRTFFTPREKVNLNKAANVQSLISNPIKLKSVSNRSEAKVRELSQLKIQQFPVFSGSSKFVKQTYNYQNARFFAELRFIKNKLVQKTTEKSDNVIRISHRPINQGHLSSQFGIRKDPFHHKNQMHKGIDIAAKYGSPVNPMGKGKVLFSGYKAGYGNMVEVQHGIAVKTRYGHLKQYLVDAGQHVDVTDTIGLVGSTGRSTGPHLHLEVLFNDKQVDPQVFLANHFGSRANKQQIAQSEKSEKPAKPVQEEPKLASTNVPTIVKVNTAISYQDYVKSVDGMFGLSAPNSINN